MSKNLDEMTLLERLQQQRLTAKFTRDRYLKYDEMLADMGHYMPGLKNLTVALRMSLRKYITDAKREIADIDRQIEWRQKKLF